MAEQHSQTEDYETPFKFNGKELDAETGYYYYGARYYDPRVSIWLSTDPLMEKYPNENPYVYCVQNPVRYIDPDGEEIGTDGEAVTCTRNKQKAENKQDKTKNKPFNFEVKFRRQYNKLNPEKGNKN